MFALQYDRKEKDKEILRFDQKTLPSIDVKKIEEKGCAPRWMYKRKKEKTNNRRIRLPFYSAYMSQVVCIFNTLSEDDKEAVKLIVKNIDEIVRQISAGQPDAKRWEKAASIIKANAVFITGQKDLYSN